MGGRPGRAPRLHVIRPTATATSSAATSSRSSSDAVLKGAEPGPTVWIWSEWLTLSPKASLMVTVTSLLPSTSGVQFTSELLDPAHPAGRPA